MDEKKENREDELDRMFFLLLVLFAVAPREEQEKLLQRMKESVQEPDGNGGD